MNLENTIYSVPNARYVVIGWEPVPYSGERINVGTLVEYQNKFSCKVLIRGDVLRCMYGSAADGIMNMITTVVDSLQVVAVEYGWEEAMAAIPMQNFTCSNEESTFATSIDDLLRQVVLAHCSLSVLADDGGPETEEPSTTEREVNQKWITQIRESVQLLRPHFSLYFNRDAVLVDDGIPVRFGLLAPRFVAHFGLLRPTAQSAGMKDARAKMFELMLARERNNQLSTGLIFGVPQSDYMLSDRQHTHLIANLRELDYEAASKKIALRTVQSVAAAASSLVELVKD